MIWETNAVIRTGRKSLCVRYFVLPPTMERDSGVPCYGIGISDGEVTHTVSAFCTDRAETVRVAKRLCRMEVTPVTFYDVLEDYLIQD